MNVEELVFVVGCAIVCAVIAFEFEQDLKKKIDEYDEKEKEKDES